MLYPLGRLFPWTRRSQDAQSAFPWSQMLVLAACRICEPIAFMSIFPYAYRMIESFNITQDASQISVYAGMLITAFAFAEFMSGMHWGRLSDRIGRKPVLLMGLFGTAVSMIILGFARSLPVAIFARAVGGLLNGNVGVLQTTVGELVGGRKEHQPRAYTIMPLVWSVGSIIGPAIGGTYAMPCDSHPWWIFPDWFARGGIFDEFPFLMPNLICVAILMIGICVGIFLLEETHAEMKGRPDAGLEFVRCLFKRSSNVNVDDPPPGYQSTEWSPVLLSTPSADVEMLREKENRGLRKTFDRRVVAIIVGYGFLAYHSVSFDALMPTFLSEERMDTEPVLPFKFSGGFALSTQAIGSMMAVQGFFSMVAQFWLFPFIVRRVGNLTAARVVLNIWPVIYFVVPYLVLLPERWQKVGIYATLLTKITFQVIAFPSNAILLVNSVHSDSVLGTVNGAAASTACFARAIGPIVTGVIHSAGLKAGYNGPAWWFTGVVCVAGALESFWMEEPEARPARTAGNQEQNLPMLHPPAVEPTERCRLLSNCRPSMEELDLTTPIKYEADFEERS